MASTDARPVPRKSTAFRVSFPIIDADGDLVSGASGLDSEYSIDAGSFTDCTNEATEIGSSGVYTLDLTSGEMNGDTVVVIVKTSTSGAKATPIFLYPEEVGDFRVNVEQFGGSNGTFSGGRPEVNTTHIEGSDATNQIRDAVVDDATRIDASALNTLSGHDPGETIMGATDLGTGSGLTALATASALSTVSGKIDTVDSVVDAIKVTTDKLDDTLEDDAGTFRFTENALEEAPSGGGGGPTAGQIADEVRVELATELARIDVATSTRASQASVDDLPTNAELATSQAGADDATLSAIAALNNLSTAQVSGAITSAALATAANLALAKTAIDAVKAKTDSLTFTEAGQVDANVQSVNDVALDGTGVTNDKWRPA